MRTILQPTLFLSLLLSCLTVKAEEFMDEPVNYRCKTEIKGGYYHHSDGRSRLTDFKIEDADEFRLTHHSNFARYTQEQIEAVSYWQVESEFMDGNGIVENAYLIRNVTENPQKLDPAMRMCDLLVFDAKPSSIHCDGFVDVTFSIRNEKFTMINAGGYLANPSEGDPDSSVFNFGKCTPYYD